MIKIQNVFITGENEYIKMMGSLLNREERRSINKILICVIILNYQSVLFLRMSNGLSLQAKFSAH